MSPGQELLYRLRGGTIMTAAHVEHGKKPGLPKP